MTTSYGSLCDDFYVNMNLNTELELPTQRDTLLHFFDTIRRKFPAMTTFYQRETGEYCLDEDRETGSYRWITLERDRICSGYINPDLLDDIDAQHRFILDLVPYTLSVNDLDIDSLDVLFGMDFDYQGNHDQVLSDALFHDTPFNHLLDLPNARPLGFDPSILFSLSDDCRLQGRVSLESRTGAFQVRTGKFKEDDQLSLYLTIRQYPAPGEPFDPIAAYDRQRRLAEEIMTDKIIPDFVKPILSLLGHRP